MIKQFIHKLKIATIFLMLPILLSAPLPVSGEVASIEDTKDRIENISEEEHRVLEKLFLITKEIEALEAEEGRLADEMVSMEEQISQLTDSIAKLQSEYDIKLEILQQVLVYYQRGGPATYLEILFSAESFSEFLKSLNVIKDITHNVSGLLTEIDEGRKQLTIEKEQLAGKVVLLENKKQDLEHKRQEREKAQEEQEAYLSSLLEDRIYYEEQLQNLQLLWDNCKKLFTNIVAETTRMIREGYITAQELNLEFGLFTMPGAIEEDTFNRILNDHSEMTETFFRFEDGEVILEVPELHLVLKGNFIITGDRAIQYEIVAGTFYELPLDDLSLQVLFEQGPFIIDFADFTDGMAMVDFTLEEVKSQEGQLSFIIKLKW